MLSSSNVTFENNSIFIGNNVSDGGIIYVLTGNLTIFNSNFTQNMASNWLYLDSSKIDLNNINMTDNKINISIYSLYSIINSTNSSYNYNNMSHYMYSYNSTVNLKNNNLTNNNYTYHVVYARNNSNIILDSNNIINNTNVNTYQFYTLENSTITATNNLFLNNSNVNRTDVLFQHDGNELINASGNAYINNSLYTKTVADVSQMIMPLAGDITINANVTLYDVYNSTVKNGKVTVYNNGVKTDLEVNVNEGKAQITIPVNKLSQGTNNVTLMYESSDLSYQSSNVSVIITSRPTNLTVTKGDNHVGNTSIVVTLTDENTTNPISNAQITVTLPNGTNLTGITNSSGMVAFKLNLSAGSHNLNVSYKGNITYRARMIEEPYEVIKKPTKIDAVIIDSYVSLTQMDINVTDITNSQNHIPVTYGNVTVINKDTAEVLGKGAVDEKGHITIPLTNLTKGTYNFTIIYDENDDYQNQTHILTYEIMDIPTEINGTQIGKFAGNNSLVATITGVKDAKEPLAGVTLYVYNGSQLLSSNVTDSTGTAVFNLNLMNGTYNLTVKYDGNDTHRQSNTTVAYVVDKKRTETHANVTDRFVSTAIMDVNVTDVSNTTNHVPVTNGTVKVYVNNTLVGNGSVTNGKSSVKLNLSTNGTYTFRVVYEENDYYFSSEDTRQDVPIALIPTSLTVVEKRGNYIGNTTLVVNLKETKENTVLVDTVVKVYNGTVLLGENTTDSNGNALFNLTLPAGNNSLTIKYEGNATHRQDTIYEPYTVLKRPTQIDYNVTDITSESSNINVSVTDMYENCPVRNGTVEILNKDTGDKLGNGTVVDGRVVINVKSDFVFDSYNITINYLENDYYQNDTEEFTQEPSKIRTHILAEKFGNYVGNTTLVVTLRDNQTNIIPNANITVQLPDGTILNGTTDEYGNVSLKLDLPAGEHNLIISYAGNDTYGASSTTTIYTVLKRPTSISPEVVDRFVGSVTMDVNVTDISDPNNHVPVTNGTVKVYVNTTLVGSNTVENGKTTIPLNITTNGTYTFHVYYEENDYYQNTTADRPSVPISTIPTSIVGEQIGKFVDDNKLKVTLIETKTENNPVPNALVKVYNNNDYLGNITTDDNGVGYLQLNLLSGTYNISVVYEGNSTHRGTSNKPAYSVDKRRTETEFNMTSRYTTNATMNIVVNDVSNTSNVVSARNGTVNIYANNTLVATSNVTDGKAIVTFNITRGSYGFRVDYVENDFYYSSNASRSITIDPIPTDLTLKDKLGNYVGNTTLVLNLKESNTGINMSGVSVTVTLENGDTYTNMTNADGDVYFKLDLPAGNNSISGKYDGNSTHQESTASVTYEVLKLPTSITSIETVNNTVGNATVKVTVMDTRNNELVHNGTVEIIDRNTDQVIGNASTVDGVATVVLNVTTKGMYNITARYLENDYYQSTSEIKNEIILSERTARIVITTINATVGNTSINVNVTDDVTGEVLSYANITVVLTDGTVIPAMLDENGSVNVTVPTNTSGLLPLDVVLTGNDTYAQTTNNTTIDVLKRPTVVVSAEVLNNTALNNTLKVSVVDAYTQTTVIKGSVEIYYGTTKVGNATLTDGQATIVTTLSIPGTYSLTVNYLENDYYLASNNVNTTTIVKRDSHLGYELVNNKITDATLNMTVTDKETGVLVPNGTITVKNGTGDVIGEGAVVNGKTVITLYDLKEGEYPVTMDYSGNIMYNPSYNATTLVIVKKDVDITPVVLNSTIGNTTVEITLTENDTGDIIPNMPLNVTLPNGTIIEGITNDDGAINITINTVTNETIILNITTPETDKYHNATKITPVEVNKRPSQVHPTVVDNRIGQTTLNITVTDKETGELVPNGTVIIKDSTGTQIGTGNVTDGKTTITIDNLPAGDNNVTVEYGGNLVYNPSDNATTINIVRKNVTITPTTTGKKIGNTTVEITITEEGTDVIIPNLDVTVKLPNGTVITDTTDENGTITIIIQTNSTDTIELNITTPMTDDYNNGTNSTNITPEKLDSSISPKVVNNTIEETKLDITVTDKETGNLIPNGTVTVKDSEGNPLGNGTVNNGKVIIDVDLPAGNHTVTVDYGGNEKYNPSTNTTTIEILKKDVIITPTVINSTIGNTTIEINVTLPNGTVIPDMPVNVTLPNGTVVNGTTDENGTVIIKIPTVNNETLPLNITTPETDIYNNGTNITTITPEKLDSNISPKVVNNTIEETKLDITVTDKLTGELIPNGTVTVKDSEGNPIGNGTVVDGKVIIDVDLPAGNHTVTVDYGGNEKYNPSTNTTTIEIIKKNVVINTTILNDTIGNTTIKINVTLPNGTIIPDMPVNVTLPNGTVINGTTDENGTVIITIPTVNNETIPLDITTPETDVYYNGTNTTEVTPVKRPSMVSPKVIDNVVGEAKLDVTVTDATTGDLILNGTVIVKDVDGKQVGNGTVINGKVIVDVSLPAGNHTVTVDYGGNEVYYPSANTTTIEIIKKNVVINTTVINNTIGNTTIEINVTDGNGTPIPNMPVNVTLPNGTVVNGTTNENGSVVIDIPIVNNETIPVDITTPETDTYYNGTNTTDITPVKRPSAVTPEVVNNFVGESKLDVTVTDVTTGALVPNGTVVVKDSEGNPVGNGTVNNGNVIIDVNLPAGNHTVIVEYGGNEVYYPSENTTTIEIIKKNVVINTTIVNETIGNTTVEINVTDGNGTPIPNMPVNVTLPNGTVINGTTNENGTVIITIPTVNNETIPLDITTPETDVYYNGTNTTDITPVKRPSAVTPEVVNNFVGESKLDVTVTDVTTGDLVPNGTVVVKDVDGKQVGNGTVINGKVVIDVSLPAGNHTVIVEYGGNEVYYPSENTTTIEIIKKNVVINTTVINNTIGNTTVEINVTNGTDPIPNMPVNVTLPNGTVVNGTTNENGTVIINIPTVNNETLPLDITTPETDEYNNGTNTTNINPEKRPSTVTPIVIDNTIGETKLDVTVTDVTTGDLVPNGTVVVKDSEGNPVGNGTVVNGKVVIDVDLPAGNHTVIVEYGGNEVYNPSSNTTKIEIVKKNVTITGEVLNDTIGNTTIEVNVTDGNGTPIPNMPVNVTLPNGTVINGTTNENGTVIITIPTVNNETIPLDITTPETDVYYNGTNTTDITPVKRPSAVTPEVVNNFVGESKLDITVTDATTGVLILNGTVTVKDSEGNQVGNGTVINGKVVVDVSLPAGNHTVIVEYGGNEVYYPSENTTTIEIIKKNVVINTTVINNTIGNTTVEINVTDGNGTPIPNMPVNVTLPNGTVINGTTNENGSVVIDIPIVNNETIPVDITTPETDTYYNGTNTTDITPVKRPSAVTPEVVNNFVGESKLDVTVTDVTTGDLVPNGTVVVKDVDGKQVGNGTVINGKVVIDVSLPAGNHTVTVDYGGNEVYYPSSNETKLEIIKKNVVINTTVINNTIGNTTVEINVTNGTDPIPNMPVNVTLPNGTVVNGTTNENGTVIITIPTVNNETIPLDITTPETDIYNNGTNTTTVTPVKRNIVVTLPDYEMYVLDYSNITVNVTDEYGNPVHGGYIIFKVNGKTLQTNGKFSVTGQDPMKINVYNGKATIVFNATSFYRAGGINSILVKYSGTSKYNQNASNTQKLTINKRLGYVEVTTDKTEYKLYETVNIKATYYDITHGNKTALYSDNTTYAIYKINGLTSKYNNTNEVYAITNSTTTIGTDSQSKLNYIQFNYTAPGPHTINSTIEIKTHNEYYNTLANTTTIKLVPSPMNINITSATFNKTSNKVTITADLKDYMNNTVSGTNNYCIKINGMTYYGNSTGGHIFQVENGKIKITINSTSSNIRNIELVTGQRYAYAGNRTTTTNIKVVN